MLITKSFMYCRTQKIDKLPKCYFQVSAFSAGDFLANISGKDSQGSISGPNFLHESFFHWTHVSRNDPGHETSESEIFTKSALVSLIFRIQRYPQLCKIIITVRMIARCKCSKLRVSWPKKRGNENVKAANMIGLSFLENSSTQISPCK